MLSIRVCGARMAVLTVVAATIPAVAAAADEPGTGQVIRVVHDLFPEIESELTLPGGVGEAVARLRIAIGQDEACARARAAYDAIRRFGGGVRLGGYADRTRTADCRLTVSVDGAGSIGAFVLARAGRDTVADVYGPAGQALNVPLPPRRALPEPAMWLFPLAEGGRR